MAALTDMACDMCGGNLRVVPGQVLRCDYCGKEEPVEDEYHDHIRVHPAPVYAGNPYEEES